MIARKHKLRWKPGPLEKRAGTVARQQADREAAHILWPTLLKARRDYIRWQAYLLWVRAIEEAEDKFPSWLAETVEKHTHGNLRRGPEYESHRQSASRPDKLWRFLETWIDQRNFRKPSQEGWMNAVGYYAVRDLAALRGEAHWSYRERQWKRSKPAAYPSFPEWRKTAERCFDEALDEFEARDEIRELIKLSWRVSPQALCRTVERYVEWQVLACWAHTAVESGKPLPRLVEREVRRRCPGFLEISAMSRDSHSREPHQRFNRLMRWIEDREFSLSKKQGWFPAVIYQANLHPRHFRVMDYWRHWEAELSRNPLPYLTFEEWQAAADAYTFELEGLNHGTVQGERRFPWAQPPLQLLI